MNDQSLRYITENQRQIASEAEALKACLHSVTKTREERSVQLSDLKKSLIRRLDNDGQVVDSSLENLKNMSEAVLCGRLEQQLEQATNKLNELQRKTTELDVNILVAQRTIDDQYAHVQAQAAKVEANKSSTQIATSSGSQQPPKASLNTTPADANNPNKPGLIESEAQARCLAVVEKSGTGETNDGIVVSATAAPTQHPVVSAVCAHIIQI